MIQAEFDRNEAAETDSAVLDGQDPTESDDDADPDELPRGVGGLPGGMGPGTRPTQRREDAAPDSETERRRDEDRFRECVNSMAADKKALVDQVYRQWDQQINAARAAGASSAALAPMVSTRDQAVASMAAPYCGSANGSEPANAGSSGPQHLPPSPLAPGRGTPGRERAPSCPPSVNKDIAEMVEMTRQQYDANINAIRQAGGLRAEDNATALARERDRLISELSKGRCK